MRRFRPNVILRSVEASRAYPAFSEDEWETLWFYPNGPSTPDSTPIASHHGKVHLVARYARCLLTTVEPSTGERDAAVPFKLLSRGGWRMRVKTTTGEGYRGDRDVGKREACFGMYACPVPVVEDQSGEAGPDSYGSVHIGDRVRVRWRAAAAEDEYD